MTHTIVTATHLCRWGGSHAKVWANANCVVAYAAHTAHARVVSIPSGIIWMKVIVIFYDSASLHWALNSIIIDVKAQSKDAES